jgi:hypothetical protein
MAQTTVEVEQLAFYIKELRVLVETFGYHRNFSASEIEDFFATAVDIEELLDLKLITLTGKNSYRISRKAICAEKN